LSGFALQNQGEDTEAREISACHERDKHKHVTKTNCRRPAPHLEAPACQKGPAATEETSHRETATRRNATKEQHVAMDNLHGVMENHRLPIDTRLALTNTCLTSH